MSIVHEDDRDRVLRAVATAADPDHPFALEYRIVRADGEIRWVLDRGQLVPGAGGRLWMDGAIFDITERRAAEEALRRREIEAARTEELRESRVRIVAAADAARRKIERDLHDGAQQRLVSLALDVRVMRSRAAKDPEAVVPFLDRLAEELAGASAELRELARGIHPAVLTDRGLGPAIAALAGRAPLPVEILGVPDGRLSPTVETTAYFTVAEALTNVAKYAQATHATVRLACEADALVVEVSDDGVGGAEASAGSGLSGLSDRVGACDGTLSISQPGRRRHARARGAAALGFAAVVVGSTPDGGIARPAHRAVPRRRRRLRVPRPRALPRPGPQGRPRRRPRRAQGDRRRRPRRRRAPGHPRDRPRPVADAVRAGGAARRGGVRRGAHVLPLQRRDPGQPRALPRPGAAGDPDRRAAQLARARSSTAWC